MAQQRFEHAQILLDLLVPHHGDHADELLEIIVLFNGGTQRFGRVHVVPAIKDDGRRGTNLFAPLTGITTSAAHSAASALCA